MKLLLYSLNFEGKRSDMISYLCYSMNNGLLSGKSREEDHAWLQDDRH